MTKQFDDGILWVNAMDKETVCKNATAIMDRLTYANSSINIFKSILDFYEKDDPELLLPDLNFWIAVADNCCFRSLAEIAKTYDEDEEAVGLRRLMNQAEQTKSAGITAILQSARENYDKLAPQREKLKTLRDKGLAHSDKKYATNLRSLVTTYSLSLEEQSALINTAADICNDILAAFTGVGRSVALAHNDDARGILEDVRIAREVREKKRAGYRNSVNQQSLNSETNI